MASDYVLLELLYVSFAKKKKKMFRFTHSKSSPMLPAVSQSPIAFSQLYYVIRFHEQQLYISQI